MTTSEKYFPLGQWPGIQNSDIRYLRSEPGHLVCPFFLSSFYTIIWAICPSNIESMFMVKGGCQREVLGDDVLEYGEALKSPLKNRFKKSLQEMHVLL